MGRANPHVLHKRPLHSERVTVWCAVVEFGRLGPYFFEDEDGTAVAITSAHYIKNFNVGKFPANTAEQACIEDIWFQQDGATAHTAQ